MAQLVVDLIEEAAARGPERTAVVCGDERLAYRELIERARALASELSERGAGPEQLIGVAIEPSLWAPVAMLAVLQAGAAYVPLDPAYPEARLRDMLEQLGARGAPIVLATAAGAARLPAGAAILDVERARTAAASRPAPAELGSLAYVIFTSGSTGRPKGVMVSHRGLANLVRAQVEAFALDRDSVVLQFAPLSFDASVSEVLTALAAGATLCLAPRDELVPGPRLAALARAQRVTVITLPPSSLALLDPADFPDLRTVVSAGEACSAALVARWAPGRRFVNAYGPTEATVCATMAVCEPDAAGEPPPLGAPLPETTVELREGGELVIGGVGVARGYLGGPGLTAERFVPDPARPGERVYRTGDRARWRADGSLAFAGRTDHQVKLRGYRVELGEVEAVLRAAPGVRDAAAIVREDHPGDARLVGYVIGEAGLDHAAVRAVAEARLPAFAWPTELVVLDAWPRTPAGKLDRDGLPAPLTRGSAETARSVLEYRLTEIWQGVLGVEAIGPDDDFFELGGHSLLAIRMLSRIRGELGVDLPLSSVVAHRTIAALARTLARAGAAVQDGLASPLALRSGGPRPPLFLVPPVSGSALAYLPLVRHLRPDRPVLAFHAPGLDGRGPIPERFEDLAAHYVGELLAAYPHGPYLLGGWSIGGALAIEMALQLADLGHAVPVVLLIESVAPSAGFATEVKQKLGTIDEGMLAFMYVRNFGRCFGLELGLDRARFAGLAGDARLEAAMLELRRVPAFAPDLDAARLGHHLAVFSATAQGFTRWAPRRRFPGRIVNFLSRDGHPDGLTSARDGWTELADQPIERVEIAGNHFSSINEPHVGVLAAALDDVLAKLG